LRIAVAMSSPLRAERQPAHPTSACRRGRMPASPDVAAVASGGPRPVVVRSCASRVLRARPSRKCRGCGKMRGRRTEHQ
jgi:hypothetical protein